MRDNEVRRTSPAMDHQQRIEWFAREIVPHEGDLRRWLARRLRSLAHAEIDEIVQEAYAQIWKANIAAIHKPRAYLFVSARNIVGQIARRNKVVPIELMGDIEVLDLHSEEVSADRQISARQEVARLNQAIALLPEKCRQAFLLKKVEGLSQREVGTRMGIAESTVEKHLSKAMAILSRHMMTDGPETVRGDEEVADARHRI
ncbi:RNA polymerase sigma factor [Sphingopyxis sp. R3-92]|uniref:RNA polymerase sigma factor n=1 Tax=Sphingopyxis sp. R3-92 TaxID=3158553 RepID=UPI003EE599A9